MPFALVTSVSAGSTTNDNVTTAGVDTTGTTLLVAAVASANGTITVSDSNANTWVARTKYSTPGLGDTLRLFFVRNPTVGAAHTFTVTSTAQFPAIAVAAYSGTISGQVREDADVGIAQANDLTALDLIIGTITPTDSNELLVCAVQHNTGVDAVTITSPFTIRQTFKATANAFGVSLADDIQTTPTTRTPRFSWTTKVTAAGGMTEFRVVPGTTSDDYSSRGDQNTMKRATLQAWFAENNTDISSHRNRFSRLNTATSPAGGVSDISNEMTLLERAARGTTS